MSRPLFHPVVARWFEDRFGAPTPAQKDGWPAIARGEDTLIAAPTGSGKTLAAFLWSIDRLFQAALSAPLEDRTWTIYVSPLKALGNDVQKNLQEPLKGIQALAERERRTVPEIRVAVRSGDTSAWERRKMVSQPPHILITTPESLYILLTAERSRRFLATADTVILDEIHAVAGDKRGAHLALSLERLDALAGRRLQRIGLSATQKPIEEIAGLLVGTGREDPHRTAPCTIVDHGHRRPMELRVEVSDQELGPIASHELWGETYDRIVCHVRRHRSTLVFVETRRLAERVAHQLSARLGKGKVAAHHGSLSRKTRLAAEAGLKSGETPVVVATASLELGIDVGHVDLVCLIGAPRSLGTLVQRVGRSGHLPHGKAKGPTALPKGILFPLTRDELVQCAAAVRAARAGELDRVIFPRPPLDILAQQMVAEAASREVGEEELYGLARRSHPYRELSRETFGEVLEVLAEGISTRRGRRSAHLHWDRVNGRVRGRRGARLAAITSGGAIPDTADYDVVEEPQGTFVGKVNEDFAIESVAGDIFLLGNRSWRIRRVESGRVRVEDAQGAPPTIPFWVGEAPARTEELSRAVSRLRTDVESRLGDLNEASDWLRAECGVDGYGAEQILAYISEAVATLGTVPSQDTVIAERFFDEAGGMQLVVHAPFGGRINRAWGLALRKRFCLTFDFELQAAATDDGFVLSLGEQHSFALEAAFAMARSTTLEKDLVQATLGAPMFTNRWRWNATRFLSLLRFAGGRKVPMPIQRMRADDLLAAVFPAQAACQDNRAGPVEVPDHPLVDETVDNCLHEAMDVEGLRSLLGAIEDGRVETRAVDTPAPSPMSHEILNANPYAFLDDAPLEERRARAVALRRTDPDLAKGIGALDPEAVAEVRRQAWPDVRDPDELHDALLSFGLVPPSEAPSWGEHFGDLLRTDRATRALWQSEEGEARMAWIAAERLRLVRAALPEVALDPPIAPPPRLQREREDLSRDEAVAEILRGWLEALGPTTAGELARRLGLPRGEVEIGLARLEGEGVVLRGRFTAAAAPDEVEWCERRLLSRIHRLTIGRLRREIEPVPAAELIRFLLRWQHLYPGSQLHGRDGILQVIGQLQGVELPAPSWEAGALPARIVAYDPADMEALCLSGEVVWGRLSLKEGMETDPASSCDDPGQRPRRRPGPTRSAPLGLVLREELVYFLDGSESWEERIGGLSALALEVVDHLEEHGASFVKDIARATGRLPAEVEEALWELVAYGVVTGDGIAGLRTLLVRGEKRIRPRWLRRRRLARRGRRPVPAGRWALLRTRDAATAEEIAEVRARQLLRRYGVVFRELLAREGQAPAWRDLLRIYRGMEARGEIRGGRFVSGFIGEQFALPEAVEALRALRRQKGEDEAVLISSADPLNLVGILTPGTKISPLSRQVILYRNGLPVEAGELGSVRHRLQAQPTVSAS